MSVSAQMLNRRETRYYRGNVGEADIVGSSKPSVSFKLAGAVSRSGGSYRA